jgi:uncharacterized protein with PIN domain
MMVDTSALAAILFSEPERAAFIERIGWSNVGDTGRPLRG